MKSQTRHKTRSAPRKGESAFLARFSTPGGYSLHYVNRLRGQIKNEQKKFNEQYKSIYFLWDFVRSSDGKLHSMPIGMVNGFCIGNEERGTRKLSFEQLYEESIKRLEEILFGKKWE